MNSSDDRRTGSVAAGAVDVGFVDAGTDEPGRCPIVLLPGTGGRPATHYAFLLPMLAARHRVVGVDFAPIPEDAGELGVDDLVEQVVAVLEHVLPGRRVLLVGYSLGAVVATALAARRPDLVDSLALVAGWLTTDVHQQLRSSVWHALRAEDSKALRDYMTYCAFSQPYLLARTALELELLPTRFELDERLDQHMDLNRRVDIAGLAQHVAAPTLVVGCTHDQMVPVRHSKLLFGAITGARYTEIASGHGVLLERPAEVYRLIESFAADPHHHPAGSILPAPAP
ncbi:alpha/beta fold hydrolase [Amycolatopsis sp. GM8]|uniref:alpha/beta fold hydrolase n=1 Tax=Amycolatopsis sp. GM8 TaxID=2896530 RepID=UPI001F2CB24B|nr:alpha/beta fold hydrolase [Amycolatopsis sp. GM8]